MSHDFLATFPIKALEYGIAISFLVLFIPFWRFLNGGKAAKSLATQKHAAPVLAGDFAVPEGLFFHPGHAWARIEGKLARVGIDEFARKLVGRIASVELPAVGQRVAQGEKAWSLVVEGKRIDMLSPVDGKVVAVNESAAAGINSDPYGAGWLLEIEPERPEANSKQLMLSAMARRWIEGVWEQLRGSAFPELGPVAQDGGEPVEGIARAIDAQKWDAIASAAFLTGGQQR